MTTTKAIIQIILCTVFTSAGQLLWKTGVAVFDFSPPLSAHLISFVNLPFLLGCISYGIGMLLMLFAFRDGELSVLYPIVATSYVWVSIVSPFFFPEEVMNAGKWSGVLLIVFSVFLLTKKNQKQIEKERELKNEGAEKVSNPQTIPSGEIAS